MGPKMMMADGFDSGAGQTAAPTRPPGRVTRASMRSARSVKVT